MQNSKSTIRQPKFGTSFSCIGDKCTMTCCKGWQVKLDKRSYNLYKMTPEIKDNVQKTKHGSRIKDNYGEMKLKADGSCSMLNPSGLCEVYTKLGQTALSKTCTTFPRAIIKSKNNYKLTFTAACPEVVRLICADPESMKPVQTQNGLNDQLQYDFMTSNSDLLDQQYGYYAISDFVLNAPILLWEKVIILLTILNSQSLKRAPYNDIMSALLERQVYLQKVNENPSEQLFQYETYSQVVFSSEVLAKVSPVIHPYLNQSMKFMGFKSDSFSDQAKRYLLRKSLLFAKSDFSSETLWKNLFVNFLDKRGPVLYNTSSSLELVANTTIQLGIIKFLAITGFDPEDPNSLEWFCNLVAAVVRSLDHAVTMGELIFNNLSQQYPEHEARSAMLGLLLK